VTALVTLFGNILQNPLDPRAKSDTKLMGIVVTFLATLGQEAETGGVHRMLAVCSEFERIARVVIEKAEKETSRRKRKSHEPSKATTTGRPSQSSTNSWSTSSTITPTPQMRQNSLNHAGSSPSVRSPSMRTVQSNGVSPRNGTPSSSGHSARDGADAWPSDYPVSYDTPDSANFADLTGFGQPLQSPPMPNPNATSYQPLLPQDLWQMPMSFDWDWAEMSGGAYPSFENGNINNNAPCR
jgi:hypothetical protein